MSKIEQIQPAKWSQFLEDFSARNNDRRARFQIFKGSAAQEEGQEAHFEEARLEADETTLVITRIDRSKGSGEKIHDRITNINGVSVQYDTDGSEDALEISDREGELVMLRFESKVDGVS